MKVLFVKAKKYVLFAKEGFLMIKIKKSNFNVIIKSEIIVTTEDNLEELLIVLAI